MTSNAAVPPEAIAALRTNSLSIAFQDAMTVILRVRYRVQPVSDAAAFRESIRKMIAAGAGETRRIGYSDATTTMALYAIVGFLDESVLNSQDPAFADWSRRPLQEEMFGGHFAGEYFFRHVNDLLNAQETQEGADALELHALCLLLGYRGKFAFGETGEISSLIRRIRDKINRARGELVLCRVRDQEPVAPTRSGDPWIKRLVLTSAAIALLALIAFAAFTFLLGGQLSSVQASATAPSLSIICFHGGLAL